MRAQLPPSGFQLLGIEVKLGALVDIDPADLHASLATRLEGVTVEITVVPGLLKCDDCGAEYPSDEHPCPVCGSPRAHLVHGTELEVARAWGERIDQ